MEAKPILRTRDTTATTALKAKAIRWNAEVVPPGQNFQAELNAVWVLRSRFLDQYAQARSSRHGQAGLYESLVAAGDASEDTEVDQMQAHGCKNLGEVIKSLERMEVDVEFIGWRLDDLIRRSMEIVLAGHAAGFRFSTT